MDLSNWSARQDMDDLFDRYLKRAGLPATGNQELLTSGDWTPRVDIAETEQAFEVKAELPDVRKEDVKVTVENGVLTLHGEKKHESEEKDRKFHRIERHYGSFNRSFKLPENVDSNGITAAFHDGVLNVTLPKSEETRPKAIQISVDGTSPYIW